ncbi:MAG: Hsp20/alpha crystallin family protein [Rhodospirillaceae bacterium]
MTDIQKIEPTVPSPWRHPFAAMRSEMNDLMNRFGVGQWEDEWFFHNRPLQASIPSVDIIETDDGYQMKAELPGLKEDDFDLEIKNGCLCLSGEKRQETSKEKKGETGKYHVTERSFGAFQRSFNLPEGVDQSKVKATFENGVLTVAIPISKEAQKKTIKVPVKKAT